VQEAVLEQIMHSLSCTDYGKSLGVNPRDSYSEFVSKVPVVNYEDLIPWIQRQQQGEKALTAEPVLHYEMTSGSATPSKHIPYTLSLQKSFHRMFMVWLYDLLKYGPYLKTGKTFMSISPSVNRSPSEKIKPVKLGTNNDLDYLDGFLRCIMKPFLILSPDVSCLHKTENFQHVICLSLLATAPELEIISIWNPSFFLVLLDFIAANRENLIRDLKTGLVQREGTIFRFHRVDSRTLEILKAENISWKNLWPSLKLISCWNDAFAASPSAKMKNLFPGVMVQGKGLLATEAPITLPLISAHGFVPMLDEVFLEFQEDSGSIRRLHELVQGNVYTVLISQKSGLVRYRLGDRVRVTHFHRCAPCLEFIARECQVSDMVGEKLHEAFVEDVIKKLQLKESFFQILIPMPSMHERGHYLLLIDHLKDSIVDLTHRLDALLQESHRYREARLLGQLDTPKIRVLSDIQKRYLTHQAAQGIKWGNIKHRYLMTRPWEEIASQREN
jgi:hypothetical protein